MDEKGFTHSSLGWESVAAAVCFIGSVLAVAIGFVFTTRRLLDPQIHPLLHALGLALLIFGIPILMLGAHFMDLREKKINHGNRSQAVISR